MPDQTQAPQVDKWLISEPGGPPGPFWGIVTQSGRVIALQIVQRQNAEILLTIGNILAGDNNTTKEVSDHLSSIFDKTLSGMIDENDDETYFINAVIEAILLKSRDE